MKWRGLCALALVLLPVQASAAVRALTLEIPVRVAAQEEVAPSLPDAPLTIPTTTPVHTIATGGVAPDGAASIERGATLPKATPPVHACDSELVFATRAEIMEPAVSCRWEMTGPLSWTMRVDGLIEPGGEASICLVVENLSNLPLWVRVLDATSEEVAEIYRSLGYEIPRQWTEGFLLEPYASQNISRTFTPVAGAALKQEATREPLPTLLVNVGWAYLARVDTEIYLDVLTGGDGT